MFVSLQSAKEPQGRGQQWEAQKAEKKPAAQVPLGFRERFMSSLVLCSRWRSRTRWLFDLAFFDAGGTGFVQSASAGMDKLLVVLALEELDQSSAKLSVEGLEDEVEVLQGGTEPSEVPTTQGGAQPTVEGQVAKSPRKSLRRRAAQNPWWRGEIGQLRAA